MSDEKKPPQPYTESSHDVPTTVRVKKWTCSRCPHETADLRSAAAHFVAKHVPQKRVKVSHDRSGSAALGGSEATLYWLGDQGAFWALNAYHQPRGEFAGPGWYVVHTHKTVTADEFDRAIAHTSVLIQPVAKWLTDIEQWIAEADADVQRLRAATAEPGGEVPKPVPPAVKRLMETDPKDIEAALAENPALARELRTRLDLLLGSRK